MHHFSPSTGSFYHTDLHGEDIPADAVPVTDEAHGALMRAQGAGATISAGPGGQPIAHKPGQDRETFLRLAIRKTKMEARRRILAVASLEKQSNDNAALALAALVGASPETVSGAIERRRQIEAIREASNTLEGDATGLDLPALRAFDPALSTRWP